MTRVQTKIILLFAFLIAALLAVILLFKQLERSRMETLFQNEKIQGGVLIDRILRLKSSSLQAFVNDYTFFDEMVSFVANADPRWASENIDTGLATFKADAAWVYRPDSSLIYSTTLAEGNMAGQLSLPEGICRVLSGKRRFVQFYLQTAKGLMEVHGATIHPTRDSERRTPGRGYFFVGRLWLPRYIEEIANLTDSSLTVVPYRKGIPSRVSHEQGDGLMFFSRSLTGWDGEPVAELQFVSESPVIREFTRSAGRQLFSLAFLGAVLVVITFFAVVEIVTLPLSRISRSLLTGDSSHVRELRENKTEFGRIAALINNFFSQKRDLLDEISRRRQTEEALRKSEERYRDLAELLPLSIFEMNEKGMLTFANRFALTTFGYTAKDVEGGLQMLQTIDPGDRRRASEDIRRILEGTPLGGAEYLMLKRDGLTFPGLICGSPVMNEGKPCGLRGVVIDLTERKMMEEEQIRSQKLESIGILAGGVAHDFNNMLTGILGNISLANMLLEDREEPRELLGEAEKASLRARDLTQQLLAFAKDSVPLKKIMSVKPMVLDSACFALRGSGIRCDFSIPDDMWLVEVDEAQMCQVVNNLIINATQAMPEGGVISICATNVVVAKEDRMPLSEGKYVKITFEDRGPGISKEHIKKIFDPYFTTKHGGTGLGLATAYSIVRNHGGHIAVDSEPGTGSRFSVYIPSSEAVVDSGVGDAEGIPGGSGRILIMDDEEVIRQVAGSMLRHLGYTVETCRDGEEAVELYSRSLQTGDRFDAVVLDLTVQGGPGAREVIKRLTEIDPRVRAIVSSGYTNDPVLESCSEYGFHGMVSKPFHIVELARTLNNVLTPLS